MGSKVQIDTGMENLTLVDVKITRCPDQSYCCGYNATRCCDTNAGYWVANGKVTSHNGGPPQPFSLADVVEPSGVSSTSPTSTGSSGADSGRSSTTLKITLGVGLGVGLVFIGLLAANLWVLLSLRRRSAEKTRQPPEIGDVQSSASPMAVPQEIYIKGAEANVRQVELEQPMAELDQPTPELEELQLAELDSSPAQPGPYESGRPKSPKI